MRLKKAKTDMQMSIMRMEALNGLFWNVISVEEVQQLFAMNIRPQMHGIGVKQNLEIGI